MSADAPEPAAPAKRCAGLKAISRVRCAAPATHVVQAGCIHEHITDTYACDTHVNELESGAINCVRCYRYDRHVCRLMGRAEPIETLTARG